MASYATVSTGTTYRTTIFTAVQPVSAPSYSTDNSSVTVSFGTNKNSGTPVYQQRLYLGSTFYSDTSSAAVTTLTTAGLPGNTYFNANVRTIIDGNSATTGNTTVYLPVQPPTNISYSTDSSAILSSFTAANNSGTSTTYNLMTYYYGNSVAAGNTWTATAPTVKSLYGNQPYYAQIKTIVDGNTNTTGNSLCLTSVQVAKNVSISQYDSSSISVTFTKGQNSNTVQYVVVVYDYNGTAVSTTTYTQSTTSSDTQTYQVTGLTGNFPYTVKVFTRGAIAPATGLAYSGVTDSSFIVSFTAGNNTMATSGLTHTAVATNPYNGGNTTTTGTASPLSLLNLSGNAIYTTVVKTTWNGNSAQSSSISVPTNTKAPTISYLYDSSSITANITAADNGGTIRYNHYLYYGGNLTLAGNIQTTATTPTLYNLYGNRQYISYVTTTGVETGTSVTSGNTTLFTPVRNPTTLTYTYDSSAITATFTTGLNIGIAAAQYTNYTYFNDTQVASTAGTTSPIVVTSLSGNSQYLVSLKTSIDGNTAITGNTTIFTPVQPAKSVVFTADSSAITATFSAATNDAPRAATLYNERVYLNGYLVGNTQSTATTIIYLGLSGNTGYVCNIQTNIDGNTATTGNITQYTAVQPPYGLSYNYDNSNISVATVSLGINDYRTTRTFNLQAYYSGNSVLAGNSLSTTATAPKISALTGNEQYLTNMKISVDGNTATSGNTTVVTSIQQASSISTTYDSSAITVAYSTGKNSNNVQYVVYVYDASSNVIGSNTYTSYNNQKSESLSAIISSLYGNRSYKVRVYSRGLIDSARNLGNVSSTSSSVCVSFTAGNNTMASSGLTYTANAIHPTLLTTTSNTYTSSPIYIYGLSTKIDYIVNVTTTWNGNSATSGNIIISSQ